MLQARSCTLVEKTYFLGRMPLVREECIEMAGVHVGVIIVSIEDLQKSRSLAKVSKPRCLNASDSPFQNGSSVIR